MAIANDAIIVRPDEVKARHAAPLKIVYNSAGADSTDAFVAHPLNSSSRIAFRVGGGEVNGEKVEPLMCVALPAPDVCGAAFRLAVVRDDGLEEWVGVASARSAEASQSTTKGGAAVFLATATATPDEYFVLCNHRIGMWLSVSCVNAQNSNPIVELSLVPRPTRVRLLPAYGQDAPPALPTSPALLALVGSRKHIARRALRGGSGPRRVMSSDDWSQISAAHESEEYHRVSSDVDEAISVRSLSSTNSYVMLDA